MTSPQLRVIRPSPLCCSFVCVGRACRNSRKTTPCFTRFPKLQDTHVLSWAVLPSTKRNVVFNTHEVRCHLWKVWCRFVVSEKCGDTSTECGVTRCFQESRVRRGWILVLRVLHSSDTMCLACPVVLSEPLLGVRRQCHVHGARLDGELPKLDVAYLGSWRMFRSSSTDGVPPTSPQRCVVTFHRRGVVHVSLFAPSSVFLGRQCCLPVTDSRFSRSVASSRPGSGRSTK